MAKRLTGLLSRYRHISDSQIIEFFSENLWHTLPISWQPALQELSYQQIADLLLDAKNGDRRYPSVWPLTLLAFRSTAHALAFPRDCRPKRRSEMPEEFAENRHQSSLLHHIFRKHVKPKKQHEICKLGMLVKKLCGQTGCNQVVDVGSGQGHLTRYLSYGLGLKVTTVEADVALVKMASKFDRELEWTLEKEQKKSGSSLLPESHSAPCHLAGWVNSRAPWEAFIKQLKPLDGVHEDDALTPDRPSCKKLRASKHLRCPDAVHKSLHLKIQPQDFGEEWSADTCCSRVRPQENVQYEHPDFVLTGLHACGDLSATLLRHFVHCPHVRAITSVACCYMKITTRENPNPPGLVRCPNTPSPDQELPPSQFGYPMSSWVQGLPEHQLSYVARERACHAIEDYTQRLRDQSEQLKSHCYRAMLEVFIKDTRPDMCRRGIQTIKKSHLLPFTEYARLGLARVGLPPDLPLDPARVEALLEQQGRVVVYFSLSLLLAPAVETLVLLDRMIYLQENGVDSKLVPLFDPNISPRNFVLVALKASG